MNYNEVLEIFRHIVLAMGVWSILNAVVVMKNAHDAIMRKHAGKLRSDDKRHIFLSAMFGIGILSLYAVDYHIVTYHGTAVILILGIFPFLMHISEKCIKDFKNLRK